MLESSDGERFLVEDSVMVEWQSMDHLVKMNHSSDYPIWFPCITADILGKVIAFSKKHADDSDSAINFTSMGIGAGHPENIYAWDTNFVNVSKKTLADLIVVRLSEFLMILKWFFVFLMTWIFHWNFIS